MHRRTSLPETTRLSFVCGALALLGLACSEGRFPVCKSDAECQDAGKGNVCYDLRCVECRYDTDCKPGSVCSQAQTCSSLGAKAEAPAEGASAGSPKEGSPKEGEGPGDAGADTGPRLNAAGEPIGGNFGAPASAADCAKRCADQACRDRCAKGAKGAAGKGK